MLANKVAFVTGAGSGLGRSACLRLAEEGAKVICVDINREKAANVSKELKELPFGDHSAYKLDVTKSVEVDDVLKDAFKKYGQPPTIVVNCAGVIRDNFILKMGEDEFDTVVNVNLKGTFLVLQKCSKLMVETNQPGSIINLASIVGKSGNIGQCNYAASKAGVELLTKVAAMELGQYGIRCNAILPGFIRTPMVESVPEKVLNMFRKRISLGRLGKPSDVAEVILFLSSEKSSYVNGTSLEVTGGWLA